MTRLEKLRIVQEILAASGWTGGRADVAIEFIQSEIARETERARKEEHEKEMLKSMSDTARQIYLQERIGPFQDYKSDSVRVFDMEIERAKQEVAQKWLQPPNPTENKP